MGKTKLACFDLDDTLICGVHSVMFLCILRGRLKELLEIEERESRGELGWIEADHLKAKLVAGLREEEITDEFHRILKPLDNIAATVAILRKRNISSIVITAGPIQVARAAKAAWGFDDCYGSDYEVANGVFTGRIRQHLGDDGKVSCLKEYCRQHAIHSAECVAVGDGASDVPLFHHCGRSIAINHSAAAIGQATCYIRTRDLSVLLPYIENMD